MNIMPGLFGWGPKDDTPKIQRDAWKARAQSQMGDSKGADKTVKKVVKKAEKEAGKTSREIAKAGKTSKDDPTRHAKPKGSLGW
jgi:hypothetical protein